jgi:hypothetical protein
MNTLLAQLTPQGCVAALPAFADSRSWQLRLVPPSGVVLSDVKCTYEKGGIRMLALNELEIVHLLADAINSERASRIAKVIQHFELTAERLEPLLSAINLELAITGRRKKFVLFENGQFKARTFSGAVVCIYTFAR